NSIQAPPVSVYKAEYITDLEITAGVNDEIVFQEINATGGAATMTAGIDVTGSPYTDMGDLSRAIEAAMETQSDLNGNRIDYAVSYDPETSRFNIRENGASLNELNILWDASTASAATTLGFYPLTDTIDYPHSAITIDSQNNILDFQEENPLGTFTTLQARIPTGTYSDMSALADAVETAMEKVSSDSGNTADYSVSYDSLTDKFDISGGATLTSFNLLWQTGNGADFSIGETLGYDMSLEAICLTLKRSIRREPPPPFRLRLHRTHTTALISWKKRLPRP
ncbi:MAG: hypothetical protein LC660_13155, partial [Desulfobacteraceae bacterium]|nr:hypothetical protein [Desulfobacteraceae bacterium]